MKTEKVLKQSYLIANWCSSTLKPINEEAYFIEKKKITDRMLLEQ